MVGYTLISKAYRITWPGLSRKMLSDWGQFTKLSIAGFFLTAGEYSLMEVLTVLAGQIGETELGAQTIVYQIYGMAQCIAYGIGIACSIRVGTSLGASDSGRALRSTKISLLIGIVQSAGGVIILMSVRGSIMNFFSSDLDIVALGSDIILLSGAMVLAETTFVVLNGAMRGSGRQNLASMVVIVIFWLFGLPALLAVRFGANSGIIELWYVMIAIVAVTSVVFAAIFLCFTDWEREAKLAMVRIGQVKPDVALSTEDERASLLLDRDEGKIATSQKPVSKWRSVEKMMCATSRHQHASQLDLHISSDDSSHIPIRRLLLKRTLSVCFIVCICGLFSVLNISGALSPRVIFGTRKSFVNSTSVSSCQYLLVGK